MTICLITGDVNFNFFVKVDSARSPYCRHTTFPSVIDKYLVERYFDSLKIPYFSPNFHPPALALSMLLVCNNYYHSFCEMVIFYF